MCEKFARAIASNMRKVLAISLLASILRSHVPLSAALDASAYVRDAFERRIHNSEESRDDDRPCLAGHFSLPRPFLPLYVAARDAELTGK